MAVRDVLQQLVVNNNLCVVKINPCNDWIGPAVATILEPLIHAGALRIVYGPAGVAKVCSCASLRWWWRPWHDAVSRFSCAGLFVCC